jgi:hypothetical protein
VDSENPGVIKVVLNLHEDGRAEPVHHKGT